MSTLPTRVDWHGDEREATAGEVVRAEGIAARIRREVAEIRSAAEFLTAQATMLERAGGTAERANTLRLTEDTREEAGMFPTAARSALLFARARLGTG